MPYANPQDQRDYMKRYHANATPERKAAMRAASKAAKKRLRREEILAAKARPCADCGVAYPPGVMEFDHVRGTKLFTLSVARCGSRSKKQVAAEIAKCEVVCANCHRLRHISLIDPAGSPVQLI